VVRLRHRLLLRGRYAPCVQPHEGKFGEHNQGDLARIPRGKSRIFPRCLGGFRYGQAHMLPAARPWAACWP
jgi:hypothetical protein